MVRTARTPVDEKGKPMRLEISATTMTSPEPRSSGRQASYHPQVSPSQPCFNPTTEAYLRRMGYETPAD